MGGLIKHQETHCRTGYSTLFHTMTGNNIHGWEIHCSLGLAVQDRSIYNDSEEPLTNRVTWEGKG